MTPLGLEIRHIEMLDALLNESHVSRAADRLAISQPAVSNALAQMRLHFGDDLLVRQGARMNLTPFALVLRDQVGSILNGIRALAAARPGFHPAQSDQQFELAMPPHVAALVMPELIRHFADVAPNIVLECIPLAGSWPRFNAGEIDLALCNIDMLPSGTPHTLILEDHWRCMVAASRSFTDNVLDMEALKGLRLVLPTGELRRSMPSLGVELTGNASVPMELIPHVVAQGGAAAVVPASFAQFHQQSLPLHSFALPVPTPIIRCALGWPNSRNHDPAGVWLREQVVLAAEPATRRLTELCRRAPSTGLRLAV